MLGRQLALASKGFKKLARMVKVSKTSLEVTDKGDGHCTANMCPLEFEIYSNVFHQENLGEPVNPPAHASSL